MTTSTNAERQVSRLKTALLGVAGTGVASFLPGFLVTVTGSFVRGDYHKLGPGGTVAILAIIVSGLRFGMATITAD